MIYSLVIMSHEQFKTEKLVEYKEKNIVLIS